MFTLVTVLGSFLISSAMVTSIVWFVKWDRRHEQSDFEREKERILRGRRNRKVA